jgi:hypothetical protein
MNDILKQMRAEGDPFQEARSAHSLDVRILKQIAAVFDLNYWLLFSDPEFGLEWFNRNFRFPVTLASRRTKTNPVLLLKDRKKTKIWKDYLSILEEHELGLKLALIFPMPEIGAKLWVMHNYWLCPRSPGQARIEWVATSEDDGIIVESLDLMLHALKRSGLSP